MTNPYQAPATTSEKVGADPPSWWRILIAIVLLLLAAPIMLYGLVICGFVIAADVQTPPVAPFVILVCGVLIFALGVSLVFVANGVWRPGGRSFRRGLLGAFGSVLLYFAVVLAFA